MRSAHSVVVLLHPLGGAGSFWQRLREGFVALGFRNPVVSLDLLGHGGAPLPPSPPSIEDYSAAVLQGLDRLGIEKADIVGVSLGGLVAQNLAAHHAERVQALVLADTVATYLPGTRSMWRSRAEVARRRGVADLRDATAHLWFSEAFRGHPAALRVMRTFLGTDPEGYARGCELLASIDLRQDLARIAAPTLVLCGEDDGPEFRAGALELASTVRRARLTWIPGRHAAAVERAPHFAEAVAGFLSGVAPEEATR